jgi:tetratricopeptide (TPR) repeat protein
VGREEELRLLKDLFHATGRERRTRLVSIVAPAGTGKSRLAWEFAKYTDGVVETVWWHQGRSPAYGEGVSFWSLGEMVRSRCGLVEDDDEATTRRKIRETVARFVPDEDERRWIDVGLRALLGTGDAPQGGPEELFAAWRTFFERIAEQGVTALVFEDLHWADTGTIDFIDHLLEWTRGLPVYIVTLARPELLERRPDWGAGKRNFTNIHLEPLSAPQMHRLLAGLVPGLPERAAAAVVERADGVPLYAVETVRMLVSQGRLVERDGVYVPVGEIDAIDVPETLTALIAARLDGVGTADRGLLQDAAVLGQSFSLSSLAAVSGVAKGDLEPRLAALVRRELLVRQSDPRSPERGQYAFVQSLVREVAYNTLARPDRRSRHLAAARYFESLGGEELAGALAAQYLAAYHATPPGPEADALATQARVSLRAAAERAATLGSPTQALRFLEQALEVTSDTTETVDLLERAAVHAANAILPDAPALAERALAIRRQGTDRSAIARAAGLVGRTLLDIREAADGHRILADAAQEFEDMASDDAVIELRGQLARSLMLLTREREALEVCDPVLDLAERRGLVPVIADTLVTRGTALSQLARFREGVALLRAGISLAEEAGLSKIAVRGVNNLMSVLSDVDPRACLETSRSTLVSARRLGYSGLEMTLLSGFASAAFWTGDWEEPLTEIHGRLADATGKRVRLTLIAATMWFLLARAPEDPLIGELRAIVQEETDDASRSTLPEIEAIGAFFHGRLEDVRQPALASHVLAPYPVLVAFAVRADLWLGDLDAARADLAAFDEAGGHALVGQRAVLAAGILALEGDPAAATRAYREALDICARAGLRTLEALAAIDMISLLPGDPEVMERAQEARTFFEQRGVRGLADRLDRALAGQQHTPA